MGRERTYLVGKKTPRCEEAAGARKRKGKKGGGR